MEVGKHGRGQYSEDRHVGWTAQVDRFLGMIREGWLVPAAHRSGMSRVARIPKMVRLLTDVMTIPPGVGCYRGPRLGIARVCCDPLMEARSGKVSAAIAWKVMFEVPVIRIVSALLGSAVLLRTDRTAGRSR